LIRLEQTAKRYSGGIQALRGVSFELDAGEMAFLTGHSGAGKSTVLRLLSAQERASRGQVWLNGRELGRVRRREVPAIRRDMGLIFQNHRLLMGKPVFDNVALPLVIAGVPYAEISRRVRGALDKVSLGDRGKAYPGMLSTGQQQRVGIARAIVAMPSVLLADEPTGNLDPALSDDLMRLFLGLNEIGVTVLVASHELDLIKRMGRRVLVLQDGQLIDDVPARG